MCCSDLRPCCAGRKVVTVTTHRDFGLTLHHWVLQLNLAWMPLIIGVQKCDVVTRCGVPTALRAALGPLFVVCVSTRTGIDDDEANVATRLRVVSVLASSTTIISSGARLCTTTLCSARMIVLAELYAGMMTETLVM